VQALLIDALRSAVAGQLSHAMLSAKLAQVWRHITETRRKRQPQLIVLGWALS